MAIRTEVLRDGQLRLTCTVCEQTRDLSETESLLVQITEFSRLHRHADTDPGQV